MGSVQTPTVRKRSSIFIVIAALFSACASADSPSRFTTDGCSLFFDRSPSGGADWCHCCVAHDLTYWRGGTEEARLDADRVLAACVAELSGSRLLSGVMFAGARLGGSPYLPTGFRWGYGWPYGRFYGPLTAKENALASSLEQEYRAANPLPTCPGRTPVAP